MVYGGNTTCIEVRTNDDEVLILDGGTGVFRLGNELAKRMPPKPQCLSPILTGTIYKDSRFRATFCAGQRG